MKTQLIGISSSINSASRAAISVFAEEFNLEHFNMRQPVIDMVAALTNMHPTHQENCCDHNQTIDDPGISIAELELMLSLNLRTTNPAFFIECLKAKINKSMHGMHNELFNGNLVSGIKTDTEAQWIRNQGGLVVHLYQYDNIAGFHALSELNCDLVLNLRSDHPTRNNLAASIAAIKAHLQSVKQAA